MAYRRKPATTSAATPPTVATEQAMTRRLCLGGPAQRRPDHTGHTNLDRPPTSAATSAVSGVASWSPRVVVLWGVAPCIRRGHFDPPSRPAAATAPRTAVAGGIPSAHRDAVGRAGGNAVKQDVEGTGATCSCCACSEWIANHPVWLRGEAITRTTILG